MTIAREHGSRGLRAPAIESRIAIGGIADQSEIVRNRCWWYAELCDHAGFIDGRSGAPIQLHDTCTADALGQILVRRADDHTFDLLVASGRHCSCCQCIVGFKLHHRPDHDAHGGERLFKQRELRPEVRFDARAGLVAGPKPVAE